MGRMTVAALLAAFAAVPRLDGALCRGHGDLWDPPELFGRDPVDTEQRLAFAVSACRVCPALNPCRDWVASLKASDRPGGVIAGRVVTR